MSRALERAAAFLFVPGDRPDRFDKAAAAGADLVILDLEDAVDDQHKATARDHVATWLREPQHEALVRINAADTGWYADDLAAVTGAPGLIGIVAPKATQLTVETLARTAPVLALIESAEGIDQVSSITQHAQRLAIGTLDLGLDLGCEPTRDAMLLSRSTLVLASRLAGLPGPVDGVTPQLDAETVLDDARYARSLGLTGKLCIHPRQVTGARDAFRPSEAEIRWARAVLNAGNAGAVSVNGTMVDAPVRQRARTILDLEGNR